MKYFVYSLFSFKDKMLYIGSTRDVVKRFQKHTSGKVIATRNRRPLELIFFECFILKKDALSREKFLKSGFGRNELKKALKITLKKVGYKYQAT